MSLLSNLSPEVRPLLLKKAREIVNAKTGPSHPYLDQLLEEMAEIPGLPSEFFFSNRETILTELTVFVMENDPKDP